MEPDPFATVAYDLPEQFGRYRIVRRLGQGGMGTVYLAEDTRLGRNVALKVCQIGKYPQAEARFRREAKAAAALRHANICPIFDFDICNGIPYLTMAFIDGPTLNQWLGKRPRLSQVETALLIRKLALALQVAHDAGVVHRDLKPTNIAMDKDEPIIIDFGLARVLDRDAPRLTQTGTAVGTLSYMAPEQAQAATALMGPATDVYSLGVILYELLTGALPFTGPLTELLLKIMLDKPPSPRALRPKLAPGLEAICLKCLAKLPKDRYASMTDLAAALTRWLPSDGEVQARPIRVATKNPSPPGVVAGRPRSARPIAGAAQAEPAPRRGSCVAVSAVLFFILLGLIGGGYAVWFHNYGKLRPLADRKKGPEIMDEKKGPEVIEEHKPPQPISDKDAANQSKPKGPPETTPDPIGAKEAPPFAIAPFNEAKAIELQQAWAKHLGRKVVEKIKLNEMVDLELVLIPPGTFLMGSSDDDKDASQYEMPQREVTISKPFYLGKFEVTQAQYQAVIGKNPSWFQLGGNGAGKLPGNEDTGKYPVEMVNWDEAKTFCKELTRYHGGGKVFSLPTEAQWEYACRAGTVTPFHCGSALKENQANFKPSATGATCKAGTYPANAWGLHDMHGNVYEWCADYYAEDYYAKNVNRDPKNILTSNHVVVRGGSWINDGWSCRSAYRRRIVPGDRNCLIGLRVLLPLD